jgi:hypothetical protein
MIAAGASYASQGDASRPQLQVDHSRWQASDLIENPVVGELPDNGDSGHGYLPLLRGSWTILARDSATSPSFHQLNYLRFHVCAISCSLALHTGAELSTVGEGESKGYTPDLSRHGADSLDLSRLQGPLSLRGVSEAHVVSSPGIPLVLQRSSAWSPF